MLLTTELENSHPGLFYACIYLCRICWNSIYTYSPWLE